MKFAFLLTQLEVGGAQVRVMQTASELRSRGHEVDVLFLYQKREAFEDEAKIILSKKGGGRGILAAAARLRKILSSGGYDVLVTNTAPANIVGNLVAASVGLSRRIASQTQPPAKLNAVYRGLDWLWGVFGPYRHIIANSKWTGSCFDNYPKVYRSKLVVVENGISPRTSPLSKADARKALELPLGRPILFNIGRLSRQKGQETAIAALAKIPDALLVIAGAGELRDQLEAQTSEAKVSDRVIFVGEVPGDRIALLLRAADVFVFPSRWETFGLAVVEAAASGLPIVGSDLDVLREVLSIGGGEMAGCLVPVDSPEAFADATRDVLRNTDLANALSRKSLAVARSHSMPAHVDKLLELVDKL